MEVIPRKDFAELHGQLVATINQQAEQYHEAFTPDGCGCAMIRLDLLTFSSRLWIHPNRLFTVNESSTYCYLWPLLSAEKPQTPPTPTAYDAQAAMQIAACRYAVTKGIGYSSDFDTDNAEIFPTSGYLVRPGAICLRIACDGSPWADIYVSTVGAAPKVNQICTEATIPVVTDFFCSENHLLVSGARSQMS